jgi:hypothetical protein
MQLKKFLLENGMLVKKLWLGIIVHKWIEQLMATMKLFCYMLEIISNSNVAINKEFRKHWQLRNHRKI